MDLSKFNKYEYFDYYDYDRVEKLHEQRSYQWLKIQKRIMDAKEAGDEKALNKALEALRKHHALEQFIKAKAAQAGYFWY